MKEKPEFHAVSLTAILQKLNHAFPQELALDWRDFVRRELKLTPGQEKSLAAVPHEHFEKVKDFFVQAQHQAPKGAKVRGEIVKLPAARQKPNVVHELHLHMETNEITPQLSIVIAHCDANCENWGWGPG